jgi:glycosyltransferase involved in cell wall biosynthesis
MAADVTLPLHIAHGVLSLDVGGLERIVLNLTRTAIRKGHRVSILCVEKLGTLAAEAEAIGANVRSLEKPSGRHPDFVHRAKSVLDDWNPDVIHSHQIGAAWYLGQAARQIGRIPVLHTEHGNEFSRAANWRQSMKSRLFMYQTAKFIDRFCCVSAEIARAVTRWRTVPTSKVEVIANGIETEWGDDLPLPESIRASLGIPASARVIGTVGRLAEVKRQDLLIRAIAVLKNTFPDVRLLLVGDGDQRTRLETLAGELDVTDRIHFAGYQSRPEEYLRAMDIFALTSRSEGFPVSLLEAWVAGLPIVCSAVGGIPDVVTHERNGLLFPSGDETALVAHFTRLLNDPAFGRSLGDDGNRTVRNLYSLNRVADVYEQHYRTLIAERLK